MKKIIIFIFCLCSLSSCSSKPKLDTFIGHKIANVEIEKMNCTFSFSKIDSNDLDKITCENAYSLKENIKFNSLIKKTSRLYLSIGLFDLLKGVYLDSYELKYQFSSSVLEVFEIPLVNRINEVYSLHSKLDIYLFSLYCPYKNENNSFTSNLLLGVDNFNTSIKQIAKENNCSFIDIFFLSNHIQEYNQIDEVTSKELLEKIYG